LSPRQVKSLLDGVEMAKRKFSYWGRQTGFEEVVRSDGRVVSLLAVDSTVPDGGAIAAMMDSLQKKVGTPYRDACERELVAVHRNSGTGYC